MGVILSARNLQKIYNMGEVKVPAVKDISLDIEKGYFYAIIGRSGSGKSTLLHLLSGFDKPTKGTVKIDGKNIHKMKDAQLSAMRREKMGFVFQSYNLLPEFCVEENIRMPIYLNHAKADKGYIRKLMETLGIYELRLKFPSQLSGGEQQRAAIARALAAQPDITFADEPTGNLDQQSGRDVLRLLKKMKKELGQTIVLVTHDMEIAQTADRMIEIQDGMIKGRGV